MAVILSFCLKPLGYFTGYIFMDVVLVAKYVDSNKRRSDSGSVASTTILCKKLLS